MTFIDHSLQLPFACISCPQCSSCTIVFENTLSSIELTSCVVINTINVQWIISVSSPKRLSRVVDPDPRSDPELFGRTDPGYFCRFNQFDNCAIGTISCLNYFDWQYPNILCIRSTMSSTLNILSSTYWTILFYLNGTWF